MENVSNILGSVSKRSEQKSKKMTYLDEIESNVEGNVYDSIENRTGIIDLGTAENYICLDLLLPILNEPLKINAKHLYYTHYTSTYGTTGLTTLITNFLNEEFSSKLEEKNVKLVSGAGCAIEALSFILGEHCDAVLVPSPFYYNFYHDFGKRGGIECIPVETDENNCLTIDILEKAFTDAKQEGKNICGVAIINPNNPMGTAMTKNELLDIINFCREKNIHLISDEVYNVTCFDTDANYHSVLSLIEPDNQFVHVVWGFSKSFASAGTRVGVVCSFNSNVCKLIDDAGTYYSVPLIIRDLCSKYFIDKDVLRNFLIESKKRLRESYKYLKGRLEKLGVVVFEKTVSGFFVWADFSKFLKEQTFEEEYKLQIRILKCGVSITPGEFYSATKPGFYRIIHTHPKRTIDLAIKRIEYALNFSNPIKILEDDNTEFDQLEILNMEKDTSLENTVKDLFKALRTDDKWLADNSAEKFKVNNPEVANLFEKNN